MPLPRAVRKCQSGRCRALRRNGRAVTNTGGAPCCCGGGSAECLLSFRTLWWQTNWCGCPENGDGYSCCNWGSQYEWERSSTWRRRFVAPGTFREEFETGREKTRVRFDSVTTDCDGVYRCLERQAYGEINDNGNIQVYRDITQCVDTIERALPSNGSFPHNISCQSNQNVQELVFISPVVRGPIRDGPPEIYNQCSGSYTRIVEGVGQTVTTWTITYNSCFTGTYVSRVVRTGVSGFTETTDASGTFNIVVTRPAYLACGNPVECNPCPPPPPPDDGLETVPPPTESNDQTAGSFVTRFL